MLMGYRPYRLEQLLRQAEQREVWWGKGVELMRRCNPSGADEMFQHALKQMSRNLPAPLQLPCSCQLWVRHYDAGHAATSREVAKSRSREVPGTKGKLEGTMDSRFAGTGMLHSPRAWKPQPQLLVPSAKAPKVIYVQSPGAAPLPSEQRFQPGVTEGSLAKPFTSLAGALPAADEGDTIVLAQGVYAATVVLQPPPGLTIRGSGKVSFLPDVDAESLLFIAGARNLTLDGLRFVGVAYDHCIGVEAVDCRGLRVRDCRFFNLAVDFDSAEPVIAQENQSVLEGQTLARALTFEAPGALAALGWLFALAWCGGCVFLVWFLTGTEWTTSEQRVDWIMAACLALGIALLLELVQAGLVWRFWSSLQGYPYGVGGLSPSTQ